MFKVGDFLVYKDSNTYKNCLLKVVDDEDAVAIANGKECFVYFADMRLAEPEEIAAGHRIDKTPLMQHLDKCEEVVKTWPKWKLQSVRDAFGIPVLDNDMGDDSHIENHISKNCKVIDHEK